MIEQTAKYLCQRCRVHERVQYKLPPDYGQKFLAELFFCPVCKDVTEHKADDGVPKDNRA